MSVVSQDLSECGSGGCTSWESFHNYTLSLHLQVRYLTYVRIHVHIYSSGFPAIELIVGSPSSHCAWSTTSAKRRSCQALRVSLSLPPPPISVRLEGIGVVYYRCSQREIVPILRSPSTTSPKRRGEEAMRAVIFVNLLS